MRVGVQARRQDEFLRGVTAIGWILLDEMCSDLVARTLGGAVAVGGCEQLTHDEASTHTGRIDFLRVVGAVMPLQRNDCRSREVVVSSSGASLYRFSNSADSSLT